MNEMNYSIQDFCCLCLSTSNEKFSSNSSKCPDNLTPFDKIKTVFLELASVMDSENRICLKCSDTVDSIYNFNKTCLKNINIFNSFKKALKENKLNKKCDLFVNLNASKQFEENSPTSEEVKIEPPESSPLNNDSTDFVLESHSSGAVIVKEEFEMNFESCDGKLETSRFDSEIKKEIEETDLEAEWISKAKIKDAENISVALPVEVFIKEEENMEFQKDPLIEALELKLIEKQENCESIEENRKSKKSFQEKPVHDGKVFNCSIECGEIMNCKSELDGVSHTHIHKFSKKQNTHTGNKSHKCDICGKILTRQESLNVHMMIHNGDKPHKCDICRHSFTRKQDLKRHMLTHTDEKSHKCDFCGKLFACKTRLDSHLLTHTGEKPYKCEVCGKLFNLNGNLSKHMLTHTGEKPYECDLCGKCFFRNNDLKRHMLTHTDEKPYKCDVCGKLFSQSGNLIKHMLIHTGEKDHKCDICGKYFNLKDNLKRHKLTHTGEKPHKCDTCGKSFQRQDNLKFHMLVHTSK